MTGKDVKLTRQKLCMTQAALAKQLNISREMICLMEKGTNAVQRRTELSLRYLLSINRRRTEDMQMTLPFCNM